MTIIRRCNRYSNSRRCPCVVALNLLAMCVLIPCETRAFSACSPTRRSSSCLCLDAHGATTHNTNKEEATTARTLATSSMGHAIQQSQKNPSALLLIAKTQLWNVDDADLPVHYRDQAIHHERRQRWSAQWLEAWSHCCCHDHTDTKVSLARAIAGVAVPTSIPSRTNTTTVVATQHSDRVEKEGQWVHQALVALHRCAMQSPSCWTLSSPAAQQGILRLIQRANALAKEYPLSVAVTTRWAIRGLLAATPMKAPKIPDLDTRVAELPFDILPQQIKWHNLLPLDHTDDDDTIVAFLRSHLPFSTDTFTTRSGALVHERRATAWCTTCPTIGALAYSGKLMPPQPLDKVIFEPLLQAVQESIGITKKNDSLLFFDAVLCNEYPDATAACAFHTDPEHGTVWDRTTCVVAAGAPRRFAFRGGFLEDAPASIDLYQGDVVHMWGHCNDLYEHAVYKGQQPKGRVSLVLKKALDRGGGRKGHGLQGQGRRRRQKKQQPLVVQKKESTGAPPTARKRARRSKRKQ